MTIEIEILGCGSSSGVPAIGNNWGSCNPNNPKNRRLRSSILVRSKEATIIVDATPDLRQQLLNANVKALDAIFITHTHADHINGIDDFRFLNVIMNKDLNLYATKDVLKKVIHKIKKRNKNLFIKKLFLRDKSKGFQEKSRSSRYDFLYKFSKKRDIKHIFLGHHLDDLNETYFMRKTQQSGAAGLSNIFLDKYKSLKLHRPLKKYTKKQIKSYALLNRLKWFDDRSNLELD